MANPVTPNLNVESCVYSGQELKCVSIKWNMIVINLAKSNKSKTSCKNLKPHIWHIYNLP